MPVGNKVPCDGYNLIVADDFEHHVWKVSKEESETADTVATELIWHNNHAKKEDEIHVTADLIRKYNSMFISELGRNKARKAKSPYIPQFLRKGEIVYLKPRPKDQKTALKRDSVETRVRNRKRKRKA